jgi:hypothetical protein
MTSDEHEMLVKRGKSWMKQQGFTVVATEITAVGSRERSDVIGFRSSCSVIIEAKISRADFFADFKKLERQQPDVGLGNYRFYLCPMGLIQPEELPAKWGLLYADGTKIQEIVKPKGNIWPSISSVVLDDWVSFQHKSDLDKERAVLFSIARRLTTAG